LNKLSTFLSNLKKEKVLFAILCVCIGLQITDLYHFNKLFYPKGFQYKLEEYFPTRPFVDFLKTDSSLFRISNRLYELSGFRINQGMLEGINCFESRIKGNNIYKVNGTNSLSHHFNHRPPKRVEDICNIKYIITDQPLLPENSYKSLVKDTPVDLYRNDSAFPRAFLLENIDRDTVNKLLLDNYTAPLLQLEISDLSWNLLSDYRDVDIKSSANTYTISADCQTNSFLFLSEMNADGWKAELDGSPVKVLSPFNFFMGVFLPPGKHIVIFQFKPLYFYIFSSISGIALLAWIFLIIYLTLIAVRANQGRLGKRPPTL